MFYFLSLGGILRIPEFHMKFDLRVFGINIHSMRPYGEYIMCKKRVYNEKIVI